MNSIVSQIKSEVYNKCGFEISNYNVETESKEYDACKFNLNGQNIISRSAKTTLKKIGQFVTFWKRNGSGTIEPFEENDEFDFYAVNVKMENKLGQFIFPKSVLIKKGIVSTETKEGKRGFRVYPNWDVPKSKQAIKTQNWQLEYFYEIDESINLKKVVKLFKME